MITPASFKVRFPEFTCNTGAQIQMFIDDATLILNEAYWGDKYDMGLFYFVAHNIALANKTANGDDEASSMIASQAVDGTSIAFAVPTIGSQSDAYYASTAYGQRYLALRKTLGIPAYVI